MNKSNRNLNNTNTYAGTTKEVSRKDRFKSSITGGCGWGWGRWGRGGGGNGGNGGGPDNGPLEDGADDIFN